MSSARQQPYGEHEMEVFYPAPGKPVAEAVWLTEAVHWDATGWSPSFHTCKGTAGTTHVIDVWADILSHELSLSLCFQGPVSRNELHWLKGSRKQNHNEPPQSPKQAITSCNPFKIFTSSILEFVQLPVSIIPTDAFPHSSNSQHTFAQSHLFLCQDGYSAYMALLYPGCSALDYAQRTLLSSSWSSEGSAKKDKLSWSPHIRQAFFSQPCQQASSAILLLV